MRRLVFVDLNNTGEPITNRAATGPWLILKDTVGILSVPARSPMGERVREVLKMKPELSAKIAEDDFRQGVNLSEIPEFSESIFGRIEQLIGSHLE